MFAAVYAAGYFAACVAILVLVVLVFHWVWENTIISPDPGVPKDYFVLKQPDCAFWALRLENELELIQEAIDNSKAEISSLEALPNVKLNYWDKLCLICSRVRPVLWIYALVVLEGILAVWLVFAGVSFATLVRSPGIWSSDIVSTSLIVPGMSGGFHSAMSLMMVGGILLALGLIVWLLAHVSNVRLKAHRARVWAKEGEIPLLQARLATLTRLKRDKSVELRRSWALQKDLSPN